MKLKEKTTMSTPGEELIKEGSQKITETDVDKVVTKSEDIKRKFLGSAPLTRFIEDGKLLIAIIKEYRAGTYRQIPYGVIASMVFTLIYVLNPFDLMPDMLPLIGQVDDVAVMGACLMMVEQDLHKYKDWKSNEAKG
jgi:uncharacterized membrane protein YkvA (DUF1232 family)